jgi:DNA processing protein
MHQKTQRGTTSQKIPQPVPYQEQVDWVRLSRSQNVSRNVFFHLLEVFDDANLAIENIADFSMQGGKDKPIVVCPESKAKEEIENCHKIGAQILTFRDYRYPKLLREIPDPPPLITALGNIPLLNRNILGMVGPRNASYNGRKFAYEIATHLGKRNFIVASGLAKGIDTASHKGSLETGTIAVVAGGIDIIYPRENTDLYHKIAQKGVVISELPFGVAPRGGNFPQRNRIISGISYGVIIVEATLRSGTLITARFAIEQNREVFAVPGSPFDPRCQGTNLLIKQGAKLIENIDDIVSELNLIEDYCKEEAMLMEPSQAEFVGFSPAARFGVSEKQDVKLARKMILSKLSYEPILVEEITSVMQIPAHIVNIVLVQLELADKIEHLNGKICLKG